MLWAARVAWKDARALSGKSSDAKASHKGRVTACPPGSLQTVRTHQQPGIWWQSRPGHLLPHPEKRVVLHLLATAVWSLTTRSLNSAKASCLSTPSPSEARLLIKLWAICYWWWWEYRMQAKQGPSCLVGISEKHKPDQAWGCSASGASDEGAICLGFQEVKAMLLSPLPPSLEGKEQSAF